MKNYLVGDKVKLVKFCDRYITPEYLNWLNDHEVNRYLNNGRIPIIRESILSNNDNKNIMFAILSNVGVDGEENLWQDKEYKYYIGICSLHEVDWINRKCEMGYVIGNKKYWGVGIATEVVKLLTEYGFDRLNFNKITACAVEENIASLKILSKNGFKQYAVDEQDYYLEGKYHNTIRFYNLVEWR